MEARHLNDRPSRLLWFVLCGKLLYAHKTHSTTKRLYSIKLESAAVCVREVFVLFARCGAWIRVRSCLCLSQQSGRHLCVVSPHPMYAMFSCCTFAFLCTLRPHPVLLRSTAPLRPTLRPTLILHLLHSTAALHSIHHHNSHTTPVRKTSSHTTPVTWTSSRCVPLSCAPPSSVSRSPVDPPPNWTPGC
jgi:hypothetical protein